MEYYYGWGLFFWPLLFFFLIFGTFAWWPSRSDYRRRRGYYGYYGDPDNEWSYPHWTHNRYERNGNFRGRGPRGYQRSDARIAEDVNDRLLMSNEVDASDIEVRVENAVITLSGRVSTRNEKRISEWIAESVAGAKDVKNELKVEKRSLPEQALAA